MLKYLPFILKLWAAKQLPEMVIKNSLKKIGCSAKWLIIGGLIVLVFGNAFLIVGSYTVFYLIQIDFIIGNAEVALLLINGGLFLISLWAVIKIRRALKEIDILSQSHKKQKDTCEKSSDDFPQEILDEFMQGYEDRKKYKEGS